MRLPWSGRWDHGTRRVDRDGQSRGYWNAVALVKYTSQAGYPPLKP